MTAKEELLQYKYPRKKVEETYPLNIHSFLWLMGLRFKFRFLCKLGFHNYMLYLKHIRKPPRIINENNQIRIDYDVETIMVRKCYCCGKEEADDKL